MVHVDKLFINMMKLTILQSVVPLMFWLFSGDGCTFSDGYQRWGCRGIICWGPWWWQTESICQQTDWRVRAWECVWLCRNKYFHQFQSVYYNFAKTIQMYNDPSAGFKYPTAMSITSISVQTPAPPKLKSFPIPSYEQDKDSSGTLSCS